MDRGIFSTTPLMMFFVGVFTATQALSLTDLEPHLLKPLPSYIVPLYKTQGSRIDQKTSQSLSSIKTSYTQKKYQQTLTNGLNYLRTYPNDSDIQLFVALSYYQLKRFPEAINNFQSILDRHPKYKDALYGLIRSKIAYKQYQEALSVTKKIKKRSPTFGADQSSKLLQKKISVVQADIPYYELTAFTLNAAVNKPDSIWDWSSVYLYRKSKTGAYGVGVNYANRQGTGDPQVLLNAQPKLSETVWLDLSYAYANNPNLFPNNMVFCEGYVKLAKIVILSAGEQYNQIENKYFNAYTGSIAKYLGNYYVSFRPTHFVPKSGPKSTLYTVKARKYSDDDFNQYIGIILASGYSPDLFDLLSVDFIKVRNNIFWIEGLQSINKKFSIIYGSGYETQTFPNRLIRRLAYLNIGLKLRLE